MLSADYNKLILTPTADNVFDLLLLVEDSLSIYFIHVYLLLPPTLPIYIHIHVKSDHDQHVNQLHYLSLQKCNTWAV